MQHHAFVIEAEAEEGIGIAQAWAGKELGMQAKGNPDVAVLRYGLLTVDDARRVFELAAGSAFAGDTKVVIIAASRAYHEAQNALLKVFEEPPAGVYLFLVMPSLGGLLPTLLSRVQVIDACRDVVRPDMPEVAREFLKASAEKRSTIIKRPTSGKDDERKRELRDEAIALLNGIEAVAWESLTFPKKELGGEAAKLLSDIATLRIHLYDRSAPVKMILEHLSLVIPKNLL